MSTVLTKFEHWKQFLGERVKAAKEIGLSEETISKLAFEIGEFLDEKVDPKNSEERVLKELWDVGDTEERKAIARMMVKLAEKHA
jgi:RAB protein geranylgeranyltransferase component A